MNENNPVLRQYEQIKKRIYKETNQKRGKVPFNPKNYLNTKVDAGKTEKRLTVRLINITPEAEVPFKEVTMHYNKSDRKSYVCTEETEGLEENTVKKCPFCELRRETEERQRELGGDDPEMWNVLKKIRNENLGIKYYIVRVIDRDDEDHGVKFWRISQTTYETILDIYRENLSDGIDIFDYETGKDLIIKINKKDNKNLISSIMTKNNQSPLAANTELFAKYVEDEKKWYEVYTIKAYDYLKIIVSGGKPKFRKNSGSEGGGKWVDESELNNEDDERDVSNDLGDYDEGNFDDNMEMGVGISDLPF